MSKSNDKEAVIEVEEDSSDNEPPLKPANKSQDNSKPNRLTIVKKKVSDLTAEERAQLIKDADEGLENDYFNVNRCKNGSTRITLRKQSTAQKVLAEAAENQAVPTLSKRYYTDNQLLLEHVINLESSFNALRSKHKKLKKRYNELEGYLLADDDEESNPKSIKSTIVNNAEAAPEQAKEQAQEQPEQPPEQPQEQAPESEARAKGEQLQTTKRRYVRSWRDIGAK